ncbi:hypothetical protein D3C74_407700 [compost metagenome]
MVNMIATADPFDASMPAAMNWADPAYRIRLSSAVSARLRPAVISMTPAAKPILKYPSKVGIQSLTPCMNVA